MECIRCGTPYFNQADIKTFFFKCESRFHGQLATVKKFRFNCEIDNLILEESLKVPGRWNDLGKRSHASTISSRQPKPRSAKSQDAKSQDAKSQDAKSQDAKSQDGTN